MSLNFTVDTNYILLSGIVHISLCEQHNFHQATDAEENRKNLRLIMDPPPNFKTDFWSFNIDLHERHWYNWEVEVTPSPKMWVFCLWTEKTNWNFKAIFFMQMMLYFTFSINKCQSSKLGIYSKYSSKDWFCLVFVCYFHVVFLLCTKQTRSRAILILMWRMQRFFWSLTASISCHLIGLKYSIHDVHPDWTGLQARNQIHSVLLSTDSALHHVDAFL